jgi:hypothetical protein
MGEKSDPKKIGEFVLDKLKSTARGPRVFADLGGTMLDEDAYRQKLDEDEDFARSEIARMIPEPAVKTTAGGISPAEQRTLAKFIFNFASRNQQIPHKDLLRTFFERNDYLTSTYTSEDLRRVARTLRVEHDLDVPDPTDQAIG